LRIGGVDFQAGMALEHAPAFRVSDADRELAADQLRNAWIDGRLTLDELDARLARAFTARTSGDLAALTHDLPRPHAARPLLASWWRRSFALVLDHVVVWSACTAAVAAAFVTGGVFRAAAVAVLAFPLAPLAYFTVGHACRSGRTIGERIFGIAVRTDPGRNGAIERISYGQAFGRALMLYLFLGLSIWLVGVLDFLWPIWDVKKQTWHDKVAGTIVVHAPAQPLERRRWLRRLRRALRR
jgi:uncharacterized RDD family membrane protein YckC